MIELDAITLSAALIDCRASGRFGQQAVLAALWENTGILVGNANGFEMGRTLRIIIVGR